MSFLRPHRSSPNWIELPGYDGQQENVWNVKGTRQGFFFYFLLIQNEFFWGSGYCRHRVSTVNVERKNNNHRWLFVSDMLRETIL